MTRVLQKYAACFKNDSVFLPIIKYFYFDYGYYYDFVKHAVCKHKCVLCVCQISVNIPLLGIKLFFL